MDKIISISDKQPTPAPIRPAPAWRALIRKILCRLKSQPHSIPPLPWGTPQPLGIWYVIECCQRLSPHTRYTAELQESTQAASKRKRWPVTHPCDSHMSLSWGWSTGSVQSIASMQKCDSFQCRRLTQPSRWKLWPRWRSLWTCCPWVFV